MSQALPELGTMGMPGDEPRKKWVGDVSPLIVSIKALMLL